MIDGHSFALCLTHDVDRPYKRWHQSLYYALNERSVGHLRSLFSRSNPYWQFEEVMELEADFGVRSGFYFLSDPNLLTDRGPSDWFDPENWVQHLGRYDVEDDAMTDVIRRLDEGGWEVGLHGSYHSAVDPQQLRLEKDRLEAVLGHPVRGGRQHYMRMERPDTWQIQSDQGLAYDSTLGSSTDYGFQDNYALIEPLDESFHVFPLTLMEQTLPDPGTDPEAAWAVCERLLSEAIDNKAIMTVLWHPRFFNETEFPGYRELYRRLITAALDANGWVGSPGALLDQLEKPNEQPAKVEPITHICR